MSTWLQRWRDRTFEREVEGVLLVAATTPENTTPTVAVGGTLPLAPRFTDASGYHPMRYHTAPDFEYESADEAKATVDANGLVTAEYEGSTDTTVAITVTATTPGAQELEDSVTVTITGDTTPASVVTTPATADLAPAGTQALTTVVKNAGGNNIAGETVTYASDDTGVATVHATTGLITAVADGTCTVTATSVTNPALTDTVAVTVATP